MAINDTQAMYADVRFGMGSSPDGASRKSDPRAAVLRALDTPGLAQMPDSGLPDVEASLGVYLARRADLNRQKRALTQNRHASAGSMVNRDDSGMDRGTDPEPASLIKPSASIPTVPGMLGDELAQRIERAIESRAPLLERLAMHWFNHFTVSASAGFVGMFAGAYDREAVRPHLLGRFEDMLLATSLHPAMLFYLDNRNSVGPNSGIGRGRGKRGLNENLAREILELHTLGVDGGYAQDDVVALAKVLTGWTVDIAEDAPEGRARIGFDERRHEPGPKRLLGKLYREDGPEQARAVLRDLAAHPATARYVTGRLADHFVGIGRAPGLRKTLERTYRETGGDLKAVTRALLTHDEAWAAPPLKSRSPFELVCAVGRMLGKAPEPPKIESTLKAMGQPFWRCPSPAGWSEADDAWIAPDALKTRLDWALDLGGRYAPGRDVRALAEATFGPALSEATRKALARAESPRQALALLVMSPEMQRR